MNVTRRQFGVLSAAAMCASYTPDSAKAELNGKIVLGGVFALSGPVRIITESYEQAVRSKFTEVNRAGGIKGRAIEWLVEDDGYVPARAMTGAKKLIERDSALLIFGAVGTPTASAIASYTEKAGIPFFPANPISTEMKNTFALTPLYSHQIYYVTKSIIERGSKKIAFFYQNDDLGEAGRIGMERALKEANMSVVLDMGYERGTSDFSSYVIKLRDSGADAVISMGTAGATATALRQAKASDYSPLWIAGAGGSSALLTKLLGNDVNGIIFANEIESPDSDLPVVKAFRAQVLSNYPNAVIDWGAVVGHVHATMIVEILREAKELTRDAILKATASGKPVDVGLMPPVTFSDNKHIGANAIRVFQWQSGKIVPISEWRPINY